LPMFGVEELFYCADSASVRGLGDRSLDEAQPLAAEQITALIDRYDQVITL